MSSVLFAALLACQAFGAEIVLDPTPPERDKPLELSLDITPDNPNVTWTVERAFDENIQTVPLQPGSTNASKKIATLEPGDYYVTAAFTSGGTAKKIRTQFVVLTAAAQEAMEKSRAADARLSVSRITQDSVTQYLDAKIEAGTDRAVTALLMAKRLKSIINNNRPVDDVNLIYQDLKAGVEEVVDTRVNDILSSIYPEANAADFTPDEDQEQLMKDLKNRLEVWIAATDHLIVRLKQTTDTASELRKVLNEAVLPALGGESLILEESEREAPATAAATEAVDDAEAGPRDGDNAADDGDGAAVFDSTTKLGITHYVWARIQENQTKLAIDTQKGGVRESYLIVADVFKKKAGSAPQVGLSTKPADLQKVETFMNETIQEAMDQLKQKKEWGQHLGGLNIEDPAESAWKDFLNKLTDDLRRKLYILSDKPPQYEELFTWQLAWEEVAVAFANAEKSFTQFIRDYKTNRRAIYDSYMNNYQDDSDLRRYRGPKCPLFIRLGLF